MLRSGRSDPAGASRGAARGSELRATAVEPWLAAGMRLRRIAPGEHDDPVGWLRAAAAELATLPPPGVIADLGAILAGGRPATASPEVPAPLRAALRAYDDDLLGRLVASPFLDDAIAAVARRPPARRSPAVALVAGALAGRLGGAGGTAVSTATLRRALARPGAAREAAATAGLADPAVVERLAGAYLALARAARQVRELFGERERFALAHLEALDRSAQRVAYAQIAETSETLGRALPRRVHRTERARGDHATRIQDDATYPAGGFTSIAPGGSADGVEGLVTSELLYLEDEGPDREVDLFDLRWVEGELLRYTRDDSEHRRRRHVVGFVLDAGLAAARVKDPGIAWQRLVVALGMVVAIVRWIADQLSGEALAIRVTAPAGALAEELSLVRLLLTDEIERGVVALADQVPAEALAALAAERAPLVDAVTVSTGAAPPTPRGLRHAHLAVAAVPALILDRHLDAPEPDESPWETWCASTADLARWLV